MRIRKSNPIGSLFAGAVNSVYTIAWEATPLRRRPVQKTRYPNLSLVIKTPSLFSIRPLEALNLLISNPAANMISSLAKQKPARPSDE